MVDFLSSFVLSFGKKFQNKEFKLIESFSKEMINCSLPEEIFSYKEEPKKEDLASSKGHSQIIATYKDILHFDLVECFNKLKSNFKCLEFLQKIILALFENIDFNFIKEIISLFEKSTQFLNNFCFNFEYRFEIWRSGALNLFKDVPSLNINLKETWIKYFEVFIEIMKNLKKLNRLDELKIIKSKYIEQIKIFINNYLKAQNESYENALTLKNYSVMNKPLDVSLLTKNLEISKLLEALARVISENIIARFLDYEIINVFDKQIIEDIPEIINEFAKLSRCEIIEIRETLSTFLVRIYLKMREALIKKN